MSGFSWISLAIFFLPSFIGFPQASPGSPLSPSDKTLTYTFAPESQLYLEGKTNVSGFSCLLTDQLPPQQATIRPLENGYEVLTQLLLPVQSMDCGNKLMNRDMQEALHADQYPFISLKTSTVYPQTDSLFLNTKAWSKIQVVGQLHIAGVVRPLLIQVEARMQNVQTFQIRGQLPLVLTDFGIPPPTALLGMVAVKDEVVIHFDLVLTI